MTRGEFRRLVERYRTGQCSPDDIAFVEQWMKVNGNVEGANHIGFENETEATRVADDIWAGIQNRAGLVRMKSIWKRQWFWGSIAACSLFRSVRLWRVRLIS